MLRTTSIVAAAADAPVLWYANRGSGFVLLILLTLATTAGVLAGTLPGSSGWPRAATQALHRNIGLLGLVFLLVHIATAVVDEFVDIRWWHAVVPFAASYERPWLGLGVVGFDLILAVVFTSLLRPRIDHRVWRGIHFSAYGAWGLGLVHGIAMGTDSLGPWGLSMSIGCALLVAGAAGARLVTVRSAPPPAGVPTARPVRVRRRVSL